MEGSGTAWRDAVSFALGSFFIVTVFFNHNFKKVRKTIRFFSGHLLPGLETGDS
jgi:hypothetical protein